MTWSPPTSVAASLTGPAQITVTWTNPGGTDWNDVWRARKGESGRGICIGSTIAAVTSFVDTAAPLGQEVRYLVFAGDGPRSSIDWSTTEAWSGYVVSTLALPSGLTAKRVGPDVVLTWANPSGTSTGAVIQSSTNGGTTWSTLASPTGTAMTTWTHASASQASTWTYRVALTVGAQTSAYSAASNTVAIPAAPAAPSNLASPPVFDPAAAVVFSWQPAPVDTTDQSAYELQHRDQAVGGAFTSTGKVTSATSARSFAAGTFTVGKKYEWQVRTYGLHASASPWSALAVSATSTTPVVSLAVADPYGSSTLTATAGYYQAESSPVATVSWTLQRGATLLEQATDTSGSLAHAFASPLSSGSTYTLTATVQSVAGLQSVPFSQTFVVTFAPPPVPVTSSNFSPATGSVLVSWSVPAGSPAAVSVEVWRGTLRLASGLPLSGSILDRIPPLGTGLLYRVIATSALPSTSEADEVVDTTIVEPGYSRILLNGGTGWTKLVGLSLDPAVALSGSLDRVMKQYAGRPDQVVYSGEARAKGLSISGLLDPAAVIGAADALEDLVMTPGVACYRDPDGRRIFVALLDYAYAAGVNARPLIPVRISAQRVDYVE